MTLVRRNGDGKIKVDWQTMITSIVMMAVTGAITGISSYYAIRGQIDNQAFRLQLAETKIDSMETAVYNMRLKDAGDTQSFINMCSRMDEFKKLLEDIRNDQIRRQRKE